MSDERLTEGRLGDIKRLLATYRNVSGAGYCTNLAGYTAELIAALEAERADNERLRARVAELEAPREGILADAQQRLYAKVANVPYFKPGETVRVLDVAAEHYLQVGVIKHPRDDDGEYYVEFSENPLNFDWFTEEALERVLKAPAVNPAAGQDGD